MEEPDLIPEENKKIDSDQSSDKEVSDFKENKNRDISEIVRKDNEIPKNTDLKDTNLMNESVPEEVSLFNRFLKEGFDGITTNPNYKLLALLIILLINLSLFLLVGNLGKSFLENSGLLN